MIRTFAATLAILAAIDHLKFGGTYLHLVKQVAHNFIHFVF